MISEIFTVLSFFALLGLPILWYDSNKHKKENEKLNKASEKLEKELNTLKVENYQKDYLKIKFIFKDSTYNSDNLIVNSKITNFINSNDSFIKKEYIIKKHFENELLVSEEIFDLVNGKEKMDEYSEYSYNDNKETIVSFTLENSLPTLREKQEFITNNENNLKTGYIEIYDRSDKTVRMEFTEKFDDNKNVIESIQISNIGFYESAKRTFTFENNLKTEEKIFDIDNSKTDLVFYENPSQIIKYIYDSNNKLIQKKINNLKENKVSKELFLKVSSKLDFSNAIIKSNENFTLNKIENNYLKIISHLIFSDNLECDFEIREDRIEITTEKVTKAQHRI